MNLEEKLQCFGRPGANVRCRKCEFAEACRICAVKPADGHPSGTVSFEEVSEWECEAADYDHIPGEEPEETTQDPITLTGLAEFLRFLLSLDDYTLGLVRAVITSPKEPGVTKSVSELAALHGCSRQAMHRKILDTIRRYPVLAGLLKLTLRKLRNSRARFCRTAAPARG